MLVSVAQSRLSGVLSSAGEALDELSDKEIMCDEDLARHAFHHVGAYDGPAVFLYNEHANGLSHREQLDRVLEESEDFGSCPPVSTSNRCPESRTSVV